MKPVSKSKQTTVGTASTWLAANLVAAAISAVTLATVAGAATAGPFDRLWVFGDSTVDTGWYNFRPSGEGAFDQYLSNYNLANPQNVPPTYGMGKATSNPGPISVEVLAGLIGLDALPADQLLPLIHSGRVAVTPPRPTGTNYATGGARNHDANPPGIGLFPNAVPTETQITNYLGQNNADRNSLYVISSGANDVSYALNYADDPATYLTGVADSLAAAISTLQQGGARYIIVTNQPESFGTADQQSYRRLYDAELMSRLADLQVSYVWADMNTLRLQIVGDPARFGITHTTNALVDRACTTPSETLGISSAWAYLCSPSSPVSKPISTSFAEQALFSDNEHWASGGHSILGSYYFCLAVKTWPRLWVPNRIFPPGVPIPFFTPPRVQPPTPCGLFQPVALNAP
jgi:phospholipase/lecithinase/hemolysin